MIYWEQFQDKWGFSDGNATPPDAEMARKVYIHYINTLASVRGSAQRYLAFNRGGMHNTYLMFCVPKQVLEGLTEDQIELGYHNLEDFEMVEGDEIMQQIVMEAYDANLDEVIYTQVSLDIDTLEAKIQMALREEPHDA